MKGGVPAAGDVGTCREVIEVGKGDEDEDRVVFVDVEYKTLPKAATMKFSKKRMSNILDVVMPMVKGKA